MEHIHHAAKSAFEIHPIVGHIFLIITAICTICGMLAITVTIQQADYTIGSISGVITSGFYLYRWYLEYKRDKNREGTIKENLRGSWIHENLKKAIKQTIKRKKNGNK